jgi:hypothetical protein
MEVGKPAHHSNVGSATAAAASQCDLLAESDFDTGVDAHLGGLKQVVKRNRVNIRANRHDVLPSRAVVEAAILVRFQKRRSQDTGPRETLPFVMKPVISRGPAGAQVEHRQYSDMGRRLRKPSWTVRPPPVDRSVATLRMTLSRIMTVVKLALSADSRLSAEVVRADCSQLM